MRDRIYDILKGKLLVSEDALKHWQFILFCAFLAIIMVACSHNAERKVHEIAGLQKKVQELRSQFVDQRQHLMKMKMESTVMHALEDKKISISDKSSQKIVVKGK